METKPLPGQHPASFVDDTQLRPLQRFVHFWVLVGNSFVRNRCPVRASALAYTTLLALIPLLAVGLGVSTSLLKSGPDQTKEMITKLIDELAPQLGNMPGTEEEKIEARRKVVDEIQSFIANVHSGALGLTGTVALVFVAIGLLSTIEATFNDIWGVSRGRSWLVRIIHYWAAITLGPLVVILVMGTLIGSQIPSGNDGGSPPAASSLKARSEIKSESKAGEMEKSQTNGPTLAARVQEVQTSIKGTFLGGLLFKLVPFVALSGAFMLLYQLMPNTKVQWRAALVGSVVAGALWVANSNFNALFASKVVSASKIYGPLAAIPVFLFGVYLSWIILLFGAQVAYAFQNRRAYAQEKQAESVNQRGREFIALRMMTLIGQEFRRGEKPPSASAIADALSVSSRLISQLIQPLLQNKLVVEVATPEAAYCPARPLDRISYDDILHALRAGKGQEPATREEPARDLVRGAFDEIEEAEQRVARKLTLQTMVERAGTLPGNGADD